MKGRTEKRSLYQGRTDDRCIVCRQPTTTKPLRTTQDILTCFKPYRDRQQEYFVTLSIDSRGRLIKRRVVTIGLLDVSLVHPREVFAELITDRAASVIICHNHPSGVAEPSREDIKTTQQLIAAGILLGIPLKDHFIITKSGYFSFKEVGLIDV